MKEDQQRFLALLGRLPARLTAEQVAWVLNCQPHDVPALVAARLIKPLGNPAANSIKFFATADILESCQDRVWLVRMTNAVNQHWQKKNAAKRKGYSLFESAAAGQPGAEDVAGQVARCS